MEKVRLRFGMPVSTVLTGVELDSCIWNTPVTEVWWSAHAAVCNNCAVYVTLLSEVDEFVPTSRVRRASSSLRACNTCLPVSKL